MRKLTINRIHSAHFFGNIGKWAERCNARERTVERFGNKVERLETAERLRTAWWNPSWERCGKPAVNALQVVAISPKFDNPMATPYPKIFGFLLVMRFSSPADFLVF